MFRKLTTFICLVLMSAAAFANPTDSLRLEMRGGKKYIIHRVVKGETLAGIAARYGLEEGDITSNNALITSNVFPGQVIKVPVNETRYGAVDIKPVKPLTDSRMPLASTLPAPAPLKNNSPGQVPVDTTADDVKEVKVETPDSKVAEQAKPIVKLPAVAAASPPVVTEPPPPAVQPPPAQAPATEMKPVRKLSKKTQLYVVASAQTVNQLANAFEVDVNDIIAINNLKNYRLKEGQKVKIPVYETEMVTATAPPTKDPEVEPIKEPAKEPPRLVERVSPSPPVVKPVEPPKQEPPAAEPVVTITFDSSQLKDAAVKPPPPKPIYPGEGVKITAKKTSPPAPAPAPVTGSSSSASIALKSKIGKAKPPVTKPVEETNDYAVVDSGFVIDTSYVAGKSLALLRGYSDADIDKLDSTYIHPDGFDYGVNNYKRDDYYYDIWAIKAANNTAKNVSSTHQRAGVGDKNFTHTVKPGETIQSIAKKYKISATDIANWNDLVQYRVRIGQDLIVNSARADLDEFDRTGKEDYKKQNGTKVKETSRIGLAYFNPKTPFKGVYCNDVPKGKIIYILNRENFREYYGRVAGPVPKAAPKGAIIQVDREIAADLDIRDPVINIEIWYGVVED